MRRMILAVSLFLCACGSDRPIDFACPRFNEFRVPVPVTPAGTIPAVAGSLDQVFAEAATPAGVGAIGPRPVNMLVLSGGGKWGAYGAGLLDQWSRESDPVRPAFDVVTGVSTGALQSTLAFIGSSADADLVRAYRIDHEAQLVKRHGKLFFLTHGSTASLKPLVEYARAFAEPHFPRVAAEYRKGRRLMVGTVDALEGRMYAIDLTRIAAELEGKERSDCYVGALLTSAAIPAVFTQVTINRRPYFDAGVRHSVFLTGIQGSAARGLASRSRQGNLYVLMNGVPGITPKTQVKPTLFGALGRLRELTFDQIEQNSVYAVSQQTPQLSTWVASARGHGCNETESDEDIFNPAFMHCLIKAGQETWTAGSPWHPYPAS